MDRLAHTISKMFLVLVLLFGSPPVATLRERERSPVAALVMPLRQHGKGRPAVMGEHSEETVWPEPWPPTVTAVDQQEPGAEPTGRRYIPVRAA